MCISISPSWFLLFPQWFMSFPTHLVFSLSLSHGECLVSYLIQSPVGLSAAASCSGVNYWSDALLRLTCSVSYTHNFFVSCSVKYKHVCLVMLSRLTSFSDLTTEHAVIGHVFYQMALMKFAEVFQCLFLDKMLHEAHFRGSFGCIGIIMLFQTWDIFRFCALDPLRTIRWHKIIISGDI